MCDAVWHEIRKKVDGQAISHFCHFRLTRSVFSEWELGAFPKNVRGFIASAWQAAGAEPSQRNQRLSCIWQETLSNFESWLICPMDTRIHEHWNAKPASSGIALHNYDPLKKRKLQNKFLLFQIFPILLKLSILTFTKKRILNWGTSERIVMIIPTLLKVQKSSALEAVIRWDFSWWSHSWSLFHPSVSLFI